MSGDPYLCPGTLTLINSEEIGDPDELELAERLITRVAMLRPNLVRFFGELSEDGHLKGLDDNTFAYRAAVYIEDLNFIHPFREGNGRVQRFFLEHLARQAGHTLNRMKIQADDWMAGAKQSHRQPIDGNHDIMTRTIQIAIAGNSQDQAEIRKRRRRRKQ